MNQIKKEQICKNNIEFESVRFKTIEVEKEKIITFPHGIIGFPDYKKYVMLDYIKNTPFIWLHSTENPSLCFLIADPSLLQIDYTLSIEDIDVENLGAKDILQVVIMVIITIPKKISDMTANLKGPIIINQENMLANQVVLKGDRYPTKYSIFKKGIAS